MFYTGTVSEILVDPVPSVSAALTAARALDDQELVDAVRDQERRLRGLQSEQAALLSEVSRRIEALGYSISGAAEEVATMLAISPRSADHLLGTSVELCERQIVWAGLAEARIDLPKARLILSELADVPDPRREQLELIAIGYAESHTTHQLRKKLLRLTCDTDPEETLRREAIDRRGVWVTPRAHGMADLHGYVSLEQAEAFAQALDQLAASADCDPYDQGDERTLDQRRADALAGFLESHCTWDVRADIVISADCLAGDTDWTPELKRRGPIASEFARRLVWSADARWQRLVTDPATGALVDMNAGTYRIPKRIREAVKARDLTCRFPGCHQPAEFLDIDHVRPWPAGTTCPEDLGGECRRHHRVKTHAPWKVRKRSGPTADMIWTSPLGQTHTTTAHDYRHRNE